jgi:serine/threonine-protein kinase
MSPEQGMADPNLDGRTDIYSLGCVLYEMLAGQPPFTGRTTQALIARHSLDEVPSISIVRQTIPEEVEDAILTALAKAPADRFSTAGAFAEALQACQQTGARNVRRTGRRTAQRKRPREKSWAAIAASVTVAVLVLAGAAWAGKSFLRGRAAFAKVGVIDFRPQRVAVLYFKDLTSDKHLGYLADGLTESLTDELSQVSALDVISTGGISQFRGKDVRPDSIARALEAGTLVDGSVESDGDRVRATLRLVDGNSGAERDRVSIVEPLGNALVLRTKLAEQLSLMLREWLGNEIRFRALRAGTQNANAWSLVQRAEQKRKDAASLEQKGDVAGATRELAAADSTLAQAEALDPRWTEPIVLRGVVASRQERLSREPREAAAWIDVGLAHAERAIAVDPREADALELRGTLRVRKIGRGLAKDRREVEDILRASEQDLRAAIASNPAQAGALNVLSQIEYQQRGPVESYNLARKAYEADAYLTAAPEILWRLFATSYDMEQFANAERWCDEELRRFPQHLAAARCQLLMMTTKAVPADPKEAWRRAAELERVAPAPQREYYRREGQIFAAAVIGRAKLPDSARRVLVRARADREIDPRGELMGLEAFVRTTLGDTKEAVDLLQQYLTEHPEHRRGFAKANPWWWRDLQNDPRFKTLVAGD